MTLLSMSLFLNRGFATQVGGPKPNCQRLFNGETEATFGDELIPLERLDHALGKQVPAMNGDPSQFLVWAFFPRGRRMVIQVHTVEAKTRFVDEGVLTTISLASDGEVNWQVERGEDGPGPVRTARIKAHTAAALIEHAYHRVRLDEPAAREAWDLLAHLLPEHDIWPLGRTAE